MTKKEMMKYMENMADDEVVIVNTKPIVDPRCGWEDGMWYYTMVLNENGEPKLEVAKEERYH